jgi:putative salt-induced outer membrane protein YdiY
MVAIACAASAFAEDVVVLRNGDRLSGKVESLTGGKLKIVTPHSGAVFVDWGEIATVTTEAAVKVKLETGEIIEGKLSAADEGRLKIETASAAQPVEVDPAKVAKINEDTDWHGFIDIGFRATGGNSRTQGAYAGAQLLRETDRDRFLIGANFNYGRAAGITTARNAYGILKYDYKFTPKFYGYVSEELLHDRFRDLRIRTITSLGVGYIFVKSAPLDTWAEAGGAYVTNDFYELEEDEGHLGGRLYHHLRASLPLGLEFTNDLTFYPNFEHSKDWQVHNEAFVSAGVGKGWTARAGVIWDYDHFTPRDRRRHDVLYVLTIGYKF